MKISCNKFVLYLSIYYICYIIIKAMAKDKKILLTIPAELNKKLSLHLVDIRDLNVDTTKAKLCIKLIELGLKADKL